MDADRVRDAPAGDGTRGRERRRSRSASLPRAPSDHTLDYAESRPELRDLDPGEVVLAVERLEGFTRVVQPILDQIDRARSLPLPGESKRRGRAATYKALDYWRLELLRRVIARKSTEATRDWLAGDKAARTRRLLGFDRARAHFGGRARRWMAGIPSDGWMSDMRTRWFPEARLALALAALERCALVEKLEALQARAGTDPEALDEFRTLYADGTKWEIHGTPPKYKAGELVNATRVTAPEAGFVPNKGKNADHAGAGFNILFITSAKGTVLAHHRTPLNAPEAGSLAEMVAELDEVLAQLREKALRVLSADNAFHSRSLRRALREIGVLENIHLGSHAKTEASKRSAKARGEKRYEIQGYPNWQANGHRELHCRCAQGKTSRIAALDERGRAVARVKGECQTCGPITLTSGTWRQAHAHGAERFVRATPDETESVDWPLGHPLSYSDELACAYGAPRFHSQEGLFGSQLTQRFAITEGKRWTYRGAQVDIDVCAVVTITHALSLERYRRMRTAASGPPLAAAAP